MLIIYKSLYILSHPTPYYIYKCYICIDLLRKTVEHSMLRQFGNGLDNDRGFKLKNVLTLRSFFYGLILGSRSMGN